MEKPKRVIVKGFYIDSSFFGFVNGRYMEFPTEEEYYEYIEDEGYWVPV